MQRAAEEIAERVAAEVGGQLTRASGVLDALEGPVKRRRMNPRAVSRLLATIRAGTPYLENIAAVTERGDVVSSAIPLPPGGRVSMADQGWFQEAIRTRRPAIGAFQIGRVSGKPSVVVAHPLRDAHGKPRGVLYASMALTAIRPPTLSVSDAPPATWAVVDTDRCVLFRSGLPYRVGEILPDPVQSHRVITAVRHTPWRVSAEFPTTLLTNRVRRACWFAAAPALALLLFAASVGCALARRIWEPLRQLTAAVRQAGQGAPLVDLPLTAGAEIRDVAVALRTALENLARQRDEQMALLQAQVALASSLELQPVLQKVVEQATRLTGVADVRLFLRDARSHGFRRWGALGAEPNPDAGPQVGVPDELVKRVAATGLAHAIAVPDRGPRPILVNSPLASPLVRLGWPLCAHGEPEGVLVFDTPTPRTFRSEQLAILAGFANHSGLAIRHAALYREEQDRRRQLEALRETTTALFAALEVPALLERILTGIGALTHVEAAGLYLWNAETHEFSLRASHGQGPWCEMLALAAGDLAKQATDTPGAHAMPPARDRFQAASAALVDPQMWPDVVVEPLIVNGRLLGLIAVNVEARPPLAAQERALLELYTASASLAVTNAQLFARVQAAHAELAELSRRLVAVQEAERGHLARELHDEIGQVLTGLKFGVEAALGLSTDAAIPHLTRALRLVNDLIEQVRSLSITLRPPILNDFGVMPALRWLTARVASQTGVHTAVRSVGVEGRRFGPEVETAIFRVIQEGLTNVARHAKVPEARVALVAGRDVIRVHISDQGTGFDPAPPVAAKVSCGLAGMRERVSLLGGRVGVQSQVGRGTRVTVEIPIGEVRTLEPSLV